MHKEKRAESSPQEFIAERGTRAYAARARSFIKRSTTTMYFKPVGSLPHLWKSEPFEGYVSLLSTWDIYAQNMRGVNVGVRA